MITCKYSGELGNNLFQTAQVLAVAEKHGYDVEFPLYRNCYVPISSRPLEIPSMFEGPMKFKHFDNYNGYNEYQSPCIIGTEFGYIAPPEEDNIVYKGYFQSEKYFKHIEKELKEKYFVPNKEIIKTLEEKYKTIHFKNSISIHVRIGGDRPSLSNHFISCPNEYYFEGINKIIEIDNNISNILVFSDNIEWCKQNIISDDVVFIEGNTAVEYLFLMSLCKHNVIGNSTFSWWSAWLNLNGNSNKIVVAPETWWFGPAFKHHNIKDLFPNNWIKL